MLHRLTLSLALVVIVAALFVQPSSAQTGRGALGGAVIGGIAGGPPGAAIGALVGAGTGALIGRQGRRFRNRHYWCTATAISIRQTAGGIAFPIDIAIELDEAAAAVLATTLPPDGRRAFLEHKPSRVILRSFAAVVMTTGPVCQPVVLFSL